jgi:succinate dehydrogenase/fumarate reductase flavoprotein subunit
MAKHRDITRKPHLSRRGLLAGMGAGTSALTLATVTGVTLSGAEAAILPEPEQTLDFDVVVIGSGMAGCAAALEAAGAGARVAMLEKAEARWMGGNSLLAGGGFSLPLEPTAAARAAYVEDYANYCLGRGNEAIFRLMADHVEADLDWLRGHGVTFGDPTPWPPSRVKMAIVAPGFFAGMPNLFRRMGAHLPELGCTVAFETKARQLLLDARGAVVGVRALGPEGVIDYRARSVVVATGGYAGNSQILEAYSDPNAGAMMVRGIKWATGDGHGLAQQAGAGLKGMGGLMALHIAAVDRVETAAGQPAAVVPHAVSLNNNGERFIDESRGYVMHGKAVLDQPGQMTTLIFDQTIREKVAEGVIATFNRLGLTVHQADTLADLAAKTGLPADRVEATIAAYNAAVTDGSAPGAVPPKAQLANRIETPPFYAFSPLVPGITLTFGGIMIDEAARALEADGRVIPGLFAAGECGGAAFFHDYIGGGALTNALVMGRIAGRGAAG